MAADNYEITSLSADNEIIMNKQAEFTIKVKLSDINPLNQNDIPKGHTISMNYGDNMLTNQITLPDMEIGDTITTKVNHTYTQSGEFTVTATINVADADTNDNTKSIDIKVENVEYDFDMTAASVNIKQGEIATSNLVIANNGNSDVSISLDTTSLTNASNTISTNKIDLTIDGCESTNNCVIAAGVTKDVTVKIDLTDSFPTPAIYTGDLELSYNDGLSSRTITSDLTAIVSDLAPSIEVINNQITTIGQEFTYQVVSTRPGNLPLTYNLTTSPSGMTIDQTGKISWIPTTAQTNVPVTVKVSDSEGSDTESFTITVKADTAEVTITPTAILLGGSDAIRGSPVSQTAVIKNTGTQTLNNIVFSLKNSRGLDFADEDATTLTVISGATSSLEPNQEITVKIDSIIPLDRTSRETLFGSLIVDAQSNNVAIQKVEQINMEAKSYLKIDKVKIEINGDDETVDDGDDVEVKVGDKIVLRVTLENDYSSSEDVELENVYFETTADDSDWDFADEESDEEDIKENDDETFEISFTIDDDMDDDSSDILIQAYADDGDEDFEHYAELEFSLEVDKEDDEITISSMSFAQSQIRCTDSTATLTVRIKNTGTDDQSDSAVQVSSSSFNYNKKYSDIDLDEGDSSTRSFVIPVPSNIKEGDYTFTVKSYYKDTKQTDADTVKLTVICPTNDGSSNNGGITTPDNNNNGAIVVQPTNPSTNQPTYGEPIQGTTPFMSSTLYTGLLIIATLVVIGGIVLLGAAAFGKKK